MKEDTEFLYEDLTHSIIGCLFYVHNSLGAGYDEKAYHRALALHFNKNGIEHLSKPRKSIMHRGHGIKEFEADFIVLDKAILELKTIQSKFLQANYIQIISELKLWELQLGLLINFGLQKVVVERIPFHEKERRIIENYDYIKEMISENDRKVLAKVREAILHIFHVHGLGYGESVYYKLLCSELDYRQIKYQNRFPISIHFEREIISEFRMKPLLIEGRIICDIEALKENIDFYDIAKMQTYLKSLNLKIGLIANFGKNESELRGIRV